MKVVGWEQKRGSIKTGQLGTGFLGPGFSPGSRVCSFRKFPRLSFERILFPVIPPTIMRTTRTLGWCHAPLFWVFLPVTMTCFYTRGNVSTPD